MGTIYEIHPGYEYYDSEGCDSRGYPTKRWSSHGSSFDSKKEPVVGDCEIIKKNGKLYRRVIRSVHFNGCVYEDVESYDVEYSITEIAPNELVIDEKWVPVGRIHESKYGVINGSGKIVVPYKFDEIVIETPNSIKVRNGKKWRQIHLQ